MAEILSKDPFASESCVRGDGDGSDAHDDVWDSHVDQVHAGVHPEVARSEKFDVIYKTCSQNKIKFKCRDVTILISNTKFSEKSKFNSCFPNYFFKLLRL